MGKNSRYALKGFRSDFHLPATGEPDRNTYTKLRPFFDYRGTDTLKTSPQNELEYDNGLPTIKTKTQRDFQKALRTQSLLNTANKQKRFEKTSAKSPAANANERALNVMKPIQTYAASAEMQKSEQEEKKAASAQEYRATDGKHLTNPLAYLQTSVDRLWQEQNHCLYEMERAVKKGDIDAYDTLENKYSKIKANYEQKQKRLKPKKSFKKGLTKGRAYDIL